jgi:hypothetical protein
VSEFLPPVVADFMANVAPALASIAELEAALRGFEATVAQVSAAGAEGYAALGVAAETAAAGAGTAATAQAEAAAATSRAVEAESSAIVGANERAAASTITLRQAMAEVTASAEVQAVVAADKYGAIEAKTAAMAASTEAMAARAAAANERVGAAMAATAATSTMSGAAFAGAMSKMGIAAGVAGAIVIHEAGDFESATNRLVTSAGEAHENLELVREGMLAMAGQVGYSSEELAAAMYTIESGGQHGAKGLDVLRASAEGAKAENAELKIVADAVTSVLQDYVAKNYSAAEVTSKLVAATSVGKTTFEELSRSLSAILPIASSAHVSLDDILGSLASMTVHGMSAQQASQNMADAVRHMIAPTQVQAKELGQLGMSAQDLAGMLSEKGLSGTMQHLSELILSHMGPSGKVMLDAFNQSKDAARAANDMMKAMPASVFELASKYREGSISVGEFKKAIKDLPTDQANLALQFKSVQDRASGFNDVLKSGSPAAQSYQDALRRVTGDATGLNVALMLTGENTEYVNHAVKAISDTTTEAGGHVKGWSDIQETFNQKMDEAKSGLGALAISVGTQLLPVVSDIAEVFANATHWLSEHKVVAEVLAGVIGVGLVVGLAAATVAAWNFTAALWANPITWIIAAIIALGVGVYELIKHWDSVSDFFKNLWEKIKGWFSAAIDWIVGIFKGWYPLILGILSGGILLIPALIVKYWDNIVAFFRSLPHRAMEALSALGSFLASVASTAWHAFLGAITTGAQAVLNFFKNLPYMIGFAIGFLIGSLLKAGQDAIHALGTGLHMAWSFVVFFFTELPGKIGSFLGDAASWLVDKGWDLLVGLWHGIQNSWNTVVDFFTSIPGKLKAWFGQAQSWLTSEGVQILVGVGEGISQGWTNVQNWFSELPGKVKFFFSNAVLWLVDAGRNIVLGIWHGIQAMAGWLWDQVTSFARGIVDGVKKALGISSPSKEMASVGMWMVHGLAAGLDNHTHVAVKAAQSMASQVVGAMSGMEATANLAVRGGDGATLPTFGAVPTMPLPAVSAAGTGGTVHVTHVDVTVQGSVLTERSLVDAVQKGLLRRGIRNTGNGVTYTTSGG